MKLFIMWSVFRMAVALRMGSYEQPTARTNDKVVASQSSPLTQRHCLNKPQFNTSRYKNGENPYFGAKNFTAIGLFLQAFRTAALASGSVPMLATGSLLGWRRHCAFNLHDGDIDMHVIEDGWNSSRFDQELRLGLLASGLVSVGCGGNSVLRQNGEGHYNVCVDNVGQALGVAAIDIYVLKRQGSHALYNVGDTKWREFPWNWLHPITYERVHGADIGILNNVDGYLNHFYGARWSDVLEEDNHAGHI